MNLNKTYLSSTRTRITTGISLQSANLAYSHPFTRQLDIVFPSSDSLYNSLSTISATCTKGKAKLHDIVNSYESDSGISILPCGHFEDDTWCIDYRGVLTLFLSKELYETLGFVGQKLPFKGSNAYVVSFNLSQKVDSVKQKARRDAALKLWDDRRSILWDVACCSDKDSQHAAPKITEVTLQEVKCRRKTYSDVHIPRFKLVPCPKDQDGKEDWYERMHALLEWVGMAGLGSSRLKANDRSDPYISLYEPPENSYTGEVTHLQWQGLLNPSLVQIIIGTTLSHKGVSPVFITSHSVVSSPVTYIPLDKLDKDPSAFTLKDPRSLKSEDAWCLMLTPDDESSHSYALTESIGASDSRFG